MNFSLNISNKIINIFYKDIIKNDVSLVILNTFDEDGLDIYQKVNKDFILVTISNINWNSEMSPWYMKSFYNGDSEYLGKSDE